ncbi:hypothetical protein COU91_01560 [Candidatus Saccharibacteria bacterium CG10_big_fil_rev_8_21_14_0_10_47_8]|nr:MAG: hypothetical protein COU91_01560 [Candidatus Saccharibacteria bacterium CG10_big_fil_rev_8_21_14_0_10_47_8]
MEETDPARTIHDEFPSVSPRPGPIRVPGFLRDHSRENSEEERSHLAKELWGRRAERALGREATSTEIESLDIANEAQAESLEVLLRKIQGLETELEAIPRWSMKKALSLWQSRKLKQLTGTHRDLAYSQAVNLQSKDNLLQREAELDDTTNQELKAGIAEFYEAEAQKWAEAGYSKDDIAKLFSEEHLASLSLEDYALLLRRFPVHMVTHVTRQGIRDHLGHMFHSEGHNEYSASFVTMLKDGRLRSPLGVYLAEVLKSDAFAEFLQLPHLPDKEGALKHLDRLLEEYSDRMAVHFAAEEVADIYYGSERGNEIFITYPSVFIASQHYFQGHLGEKGGGYWNDQWVWADEERGLDLDAALVFIPANTQVDKKTGSRYKLDESNKPMVNQILTEPLRLMVESDDFDSLVNLWQKVPKRSNLNKTIWDIASEEGELYGDPEVDEAVRQIVTALGNYGITDKVTQYAILNSDFLDELPPKYAGESINDRVEIYMQKNGIYFVLADDTVPAQEYWDAYFRANPDDKPSKMVYYTGDDPTEALDKWRSSKSLYPHRVDKSIGFDEHNIGVEHPQAIAGFDRFKALAIKTIEDYYESN